VIVRPEAEVEGLRAETIVDRLLAGVAVPRDAGAPAPSAQA
jgi:hypothetical protein